MSILIAIILSFFLSGPVMSGEQGSLSESGVVWLSSAER